MGGDGGESCPLIAIYGTIYGMVKTTVYLEADLALALRQLSTAQGRPQAALIREALATYTRRATYPKPKRTSDYRSGRSDVSERAEELIRQAVRERRWP